MLSSVIPIAPPAQPDYLDLTKNVRQAIYEITDMMGESGGWTKCFKRFKVGISLWTNCNLLDGSR